MHPADCIFLIAIYKIWKYIAEPPQFFSSFYGNDCIVIKGWPLFATEPMKGLREKNLTKVCLEVMSCIDILATEVAFRCIPSDKWAFFYSEFKFEKHKKCPVVLWWIGWHFIIIQSQLLTISDHCRATVVLELKVTGEWLVNDQPKVTSQQGPPLHWHNAEIYIQKKCVQDLTKTTLIVLPCILRAVFPQLHLSRDPIIAHHWFQA